LLAGTNLADIATGWGSDELRLVELQLLGALGELARTPRLTARRMRLDTRAVRVNDMWWMASIAGIAERLMPCRFPDTRFDRVSRVDTR
jgi:hypothetical protein